MKECVSNEFALFFYRQWYGAFSHIVSWHHMCYIISDNIPRCYDYRQPLVTPHFGGIFTTCELRACEWRQL